MLSQSTEKLTVVSTPMNLLSRVATGTPRVLAAVMVVLLLVYFFLPETAFCAAWWKSFLA